MTMQHIQSNCTNTCLSKNTINPITVCVNWLQSSRSLSSLHIYVSVQGSRALPHLHSPWQPFYWLHLHLIKSRTALDASGKSVQSGINLPLSYFHPIPLSMAVLELPSRTDPTRGLHNMLLGARFHNTAPVGGILLIALPWLKSSHLHSFVIRAFEERL